MAMPISGIAIVALLAAAGAGADSDAKIHKAQVIGADGAPIGTVSAEATPHGVLITADVQGLPPGAHGFHIHETGRCDSADGFASAGGHYTPDGNAHGFRTAEGPHAGDMPNQFAGGDGRLQAVVLNSFVTIDGDSAPLQDADGSALVIHAGTDDYGSQPSGEAGGRIACAVLAPPQS